MAPTATSTVAPTPEPTIEPTAAPSPSPAPTVAPTPAPTPSPSAAPTPTASAAPTEVLGFGAGTVGGAGGPTIVVTDVAQLRAALALSGPRIVQIDGSGTWDIRDSISIRSPFLTLIGDPGVTLRGWLMVRTSQVIIWGLRIATGDVGVTAGDADPIGIIGPADHIVIRGNTLVWGPDVGGLTILGNVSDVTVQDNIIGEGLRLSKHPEGVESQGGHSLAMNISPLSPGQTIRRVTITRNLITRSDQRMPKLNGAREVDFVNNLVFDWGHKGPSGNGDINVVGNYLLPGPDTAVAPRVWLPQTVSNDPTLIAGAVYVAGNVIEGIAGEPVSGPLTVYRDTPGHPLSVTPMTATEARDYVLAHAGAPRGPLEDRIVADVLAGIGGYFNGEGYPPPNPEWP